MNLTILDTLYGKPWWLRGKESTCNAGDTSSITELGRYSGKGNDNPLQYSSHGQRRVTVRGVAKSRTQLTTHTQVPHVGGIKHYLPALNVYWNTLKVSLIHQIVVYLARQFSHILSRLHISLLPVNPMYG